MFQQSLHQDVRDSPRLRRVWKESAGGCPGQNHGQFAAEGGVFLFKKDETALWMYFGCFVNRAAASNEVMPTQFSVCPAANEVYSGTNEGLTPPPPGALSVVVRCDFKVYVGLLQHV